MIKIHGLGAFGIVPFLTEDTLKQAKLANISTRAGKIAYLMSLGEKAKKPEIKEGIAPARGALKWIAKVMDEEEEKK
ncbi:MAG: hypothetical protein QME05_01470 [Candidatus Margulisbacteria bacterium]|nr:hypothetical protein [Candidatus Margulisiibacteriota bacterium]